MVNLELYKVFCTVARCGSLTRAAQELFISQPAVSQAIKQLENQLGVSLFNRTRKGMQLSATGGKIIYADISEAMRLIGEAESRLSEIKTVATGTIRIGATDSIFYHILADKIAAFNEKYPSVKFELISATSPYTISQIKEGKCDVAFVNLPVSDDEVKFCGTVAHLSDIFIVGEKFFDYAEKIVPLKKLQELPLIMIEENTVARRSFETFTHNLGIKLRPDTEVANWDLMIKLVIKGMGVGCIPREYCTDYLLSGELKELATSPSLPVRGVGIALSKKQPLSFAMKEFISLFGEQYDIELF